MLKMLQWWCSLTHSLSLTASDNSDDTIEVRRLVLITLAARQLGLRTPAWARNLARSPLRFRSTTSRSTLRSAWFFPLPLTAPLCSADFSARSVPFSVPLTRLCQFSSENNISYPIAIARAKLRAALFISTMLWFQTFNILWQKLMWLVVVNCRRVSSKRKCQILKYLAARRT